MTDRQCCPVTSLGLHVTGANAAYLATRARRGGHDLLSLGLDRVAEPHRHAGPRAGPLAGPADLGLDAP
jgi:hypothetical protein